MSLNYAILGLLTFEPMSGYTLKTRYFDKSIAHFWPADQAQIYRTLTALEAAGQVEGRTVVNETRPNRREFSIAEPGRAALAGWLAEDREPPAMRDAFLVQLYFGRLLTRDQMRRVLETRRAAHEKQRDYYDALTLPQPDTEEMRRQVLFGGMTLDFARRRERMTIEWLDACIAALEDAPDDGPKG